MKRSIIETSETVLKMLHDLLGDEILNKTNKELMEIVEKQLGYKLKNGMFIKSTVSSSTSQSLITSATQSASQLAQSVGSSATKVATAVKDKLATTIEIVSTSGTGATATVTAGKVGVMATSLPTAFAAIAPLLGVGVGAGLYKLNPDFWEKVSRTLLPFCYDDTDMLPAVVDENGQTYYSQEVIDAIENLFTEEGVINSDFIKPVPVEGITNLPTDTKVIKTDYYCCNIRTGGIDTKVKSRIFNSNFKGKTYLIPLIYGMESGTYNLVNQNQSSAISDLIVGGEPYIRVLVHSEPTNKLIFDGYGGEYIRNKSYGKSNELISYGFKDVTKYPLYGGLQTCGTGGDYYYYFAKSDYKSATKYERAIWELFYGGGHTVGDSPQGLEQISTDSNYSKENSKDILSGIDKDGNIKTDKYIPVRLPSSTDGTSTSTKENSQTNLDEDGVLDNSLISQIMESINNMYKPLPNINYNPDKDVTEEGDGDSPTKPIIPNDIIPEEPNDDGESPSLLPVGSLNTSGLVTIYNPTESEVKEFGKWLWTTWSSDLMDTLAKMFNNPMDAVIGLHLIYATPIVNTRDTIKAGFLDSKVETNVVEQRYVSIFCGSMIVPQYWGNYLDFLPYTKTYIYLPFIGIQKLNTMDIVSSAVSIEYKIDVFNGSCIALITVARENYSTVMYEFSGNCAVQIPITSGNYSSILSSAISSVASGVGFVMGGAGVGATIAFAGSNMMGNKTDVQHSGSFGASHGAMGIKKPYIMVKRPIQKVVPDYNTLYGYPAHKMVKISDCSGYLRVKEVDVLSATATDEEKKIIENLLKQGVFV